MIKTEKTIISVPRDEKVEEERYQNWKDTKNEMLFIGLNAHFSFFFLFFVVSVDLIDSYICEINKGYKLEKKTENNHSDVSVPNTHSIADADWLHGENGMLSFNVWFLHISLASMHAAHRAPSTTHCN